MYAYIIFKYWNHNTKFTITFIHAEMELLDFLIGKSDTQGSPLCFFVLPVLFVFLQVVFFNGWSTGEIRHSGEGVEKCVWRGSLHCTEWSLTVMQTPMFPWKPLSTTEYTRAIFEPFVHLINYVFVPKAAWLDCLIMY